jgi:uncharacterized protein YjbI with pentapeptide repeats
MMTREELLRVLDETASTGRLITIRDVVAPGIDLSGRSLEGATFEHVDLTGAVLRGCDLDSVAFVACALDRADFGGANLYKASISRSSLRDANLRGANLRRAGIHSSTVVGADLSEADLTRAALSETDLRGANLTGTIFFETVMVDVRGHGARGAWLRSDDNRVERLDMSPAGDGSDVRDVAALVDPEHGRPRPIRIRLRGTPGTPVIVREEPNAPEREVELASLPLDEPTRAALQTWSEQRDELVLEPADALDAALAAIHLKGRSLWRTLSSLLSDYRVRYEPPGGGAVEEPPGE